MSGVDILSALVAIADPRTGNPTKEFMIKWAQLMSSLSGVPNISALIDAQIGNTQGDILYRNATAWVILGPGTAGQSLTTGGAAANPSWSSISVNISALIDAQIGSTQGDILYRGASGWVALPPGPAGEVLTTNGAGANPGWATAGGGAHGVPVYTPPIIANLNIFQLLGAGTQTQVTAGAIPNLSIVPGLTDTQGYLYCALQAAPSGTFKAILKSHVNWFNLAISAYDGCGLVMRNSANGYATMLLRQGASLPQLSMWQYANNPTNINNTYIGAVDTSDQGVFLHFEYDGININVGLSDDGLTQIPVLSISAVSVLGAAPDQVGIGWSGQYLVNPALPTVGPKYSLWHYYCSVSGNGITYL